MELFWLMIIINLLTFLWLTVTAFIRSVLWGILVLLFSPITAIAFGIVYFRDAKLPFLSYLASGILAIVAVVIMDAKELDALYKQSGMMPPSELSSPAGGTNAPTTNTAPLVTPNKDGNASPATTAASAPTDMAQGQVPLEEILNPTVQRPLPAKHADAPIDPLQVKKTTAPPPTTKIKHSQANQYIGRYFIVVMNNKVERCGILKRLDANNLYLQRKWHSTGDSAEFAVRRTQVKSIDVLKQGQTPPDCRK